MLTAVLLAGGLALGISPVIIAIAAVAAIEPRLVLAGAVIWAQTGERTTVDVTRDRLGHAPDAEVPPQPLE